MDIIMPPFTDSSLRSEKIRPNTALLLLELGGRAHITTMRETIIQRLSIGMIIPTTERCIKSRKAAGLAFIPGAPFDPDEGNRYYITIDGAFIQVPFEPHRIAPVEWTLEEVLEHPRNWLIVMEALVSGNLPPGVERA